MSRFLTLLLSVGLMMLVACGVAASASPSNPASTYDFAPTLRDTVANVIEPTYATLRDRTTALDGAVSTLASSPSEENLGLARQAWRAAREPWERGEAFLFGPVEERGLDPSLDSWPVDRVQLDQVLASGLELTTRSIVDNFGSGLRGFHTIEYLLWGASGTKGVSDFTARELLYLAAASGALANDSQALLAAWVGNANQVGYGQRFASAGTSGSVFQSRLDAVQQLFQGMIDICDEVANGKIADPYKARDRQLEESRFSNNSIADFSDNILSARNIYTGTTGAQAGASLSAFVRSVDPDRDAKIGAALDRAIARIVAIGADGQTFGDAISTPAKAPLIEEAQAAVREAMQALQACVTVLVAG